MAVDFGILAQTPTIGARYAEGLQLAQAERERNMLRAAQVQQMQMQQKNMLAQEEERKAQAALRGQQELELKSRMERAARNEKLLSGLGDLLQQNGYKLDRPTLGRMAQVSTQVGDAAGAKLAMEGLRALDDREALQAAFGPQAGAAPAAPAAAPAAPAAAPSMMRQPPAAAAPAAPANMFAGTMADIGTTQPAPVNALAAPAQAPAAPVAAPAGGVPSVERLRAIIADPASPEVVVKRAKALLAAAPKEPTVPTAIQEFQHYQKMPPAEQAAYMQHRQALQPKPAQTNIQLPPQEKAERGKRGELLVKQFEAVSEAARIAARTLSALDTQERILDSGFKTGFGTEAQKAGASVLAALGVPEANKFATDAQTFLSATQQAVLQRQLEQKGPQTEADAQRITQTGAQLGNTPDANKFIVSVAKAQLKRDIEQRNFYDKWWKENKTYDGAEDAWFSGDGGKSLFDRPELKRYAAPAKAAPAAAAGVQPYKDAEKERRYQEWKRSQGKP